MPSDKFTPNVDDPPIPMFQPSVNGELRWGRVGTVRVQPISRFESLCRLFQFAHHHRVQSGRIDPQPSQMHFSVLQLFPPFSRTWSAEAHGCLIGAATLVLWSLAGLPSSAVFGGAYAAVRREGRKVAEASFLTCSHLRRARVRNVTTKLVTSALSWAASAGVDDLYVVSDGNNLSFWCNRLGFEVVQAEERTLKSSNNILIRLDVRSLRTGARSPCTMLAHLQFGEVPFSDAPEASHALREEDVACLLLNRPDLCAELTDSQRAMLRYMFPNALWLAERCNLFSARTSLIELSAR